MAKKTTKTKTKAKNVSEVVDEPTRCPKCQSSSRSKYHSTRTQEISGLRKGVPYNRITYRYCACLSCGQSRVEKSFDQVVSRLAGSSETA
jgi:hypothetical protein